MEGRREWGEGDMGEVVGELGGGDQGKDKENQVEGDHEKDKVAHNKKIGWADQLSLPLTLSGSR